MRLSVPVRLQAGVEVGGSVGAGHGRVVLKPAQFADQLHDLGTGERAGAVEAGGRTRAGGQRDDDGGPAVATGQAQRADGGEGEDGRGQGSNSLVAFLVEILQVFEARGDGTAHLDAGALQVVVCLAPLFVVHVAAGGNPCSVAGKNRFSDSRVRLWHEIDAPVSRRASTLTRSG